VDDKSIVMIFFEKLRTYLIKNMRMSHVYQPIMIKHLLENNGRAKAEEIAIDLVQNDLSQVEYYTERVNSMVGKVLRKNHIVVKEKNEYELIGYRDLKENDKDELIELCQTKIEEYKQKRGMLIWDHRRKNRSPIDGSIRYQVLNRANNVCELCGIPSDVRALEVDHIVPKNWKGIDDLVNYQALCYKCNANKRDTDDTDFRNRVALFDVRASYGKCNFCDTSLDDILFQNNLALKSAEVNAIHDLMKSVKKIHVAQTNGSSGFDIVIDQFDDSLKEHTFIKMTPVHYTTR
jgi:5-methylcytosine-specific restriction endonuclease McrA